jgi:hypothetical protein
LEFRLAIPVDVLDVVIFKDAQAGAAFQPSSFQYRATLCGFHAFSKTMNPGAPSNLRLVCSLWHNLKLKPLEITTYKRKYFALFYGSR